MLRRLAPLALPLTACLLGVGLMFHPTLLSGFHRMHWDLSDTRHNLWTLEHAYLWLTGAPGHERLWSPAVFYPVPGTFAYSENSLGVLPLYAPFRAAGIDPYTSLQLFSLAVASLNFIAAFLLFSRGLRLSVVPASAGAFLFAFANMRTSQLGHIFLLPQFFLVGAAWALARLVAGAREAERARPRLALLALAACLGAQFWANLYHAWLFGLCLMVFSAIALCHRECRTAVVQWVRWHWRSVVAAVALLTAIVAPLVARYRGTVLAVGQRPFAVVEPFLVEPAAWLNMGPHNWLYGSRAALAGLRPQINEGEKRLGLGVAATLLAVAGVWFHRRRTSVRLLAVAVVVAALLVTRVGPCSPWCFVHSFVPGAGGFRAVSRLGLELLLPVSAFVALAFAELQARRAWLVAVLAGILLVAEQAQSAPTFDKRAAHARAEELARRVGSECKVFYYSPLVRGEHWSRIHLDAMWAGLLLNRPTINGYSSAEPPGYLPLRLDGPGAPGEEQRLAAALAEWEQLHHLDPASVCWIK